MKKSLKSDVQAVTRELKALIKKTERLTKAVDKLEKAKPAAKPKAKPKRKTAAKKTAKKKAPARKKAVKKKAAAKKKPAKKGGVTATAKVLGIIKKTKKGVDVPAIMSKTKFDEKKVRNIVARAFKQKKIKRKGRGIYVGK